VQKLDARTSKEVVNMAKEPLKLREKLEKWGFKDLPIFNPNEYRRKLVDLDEDFNYYVAEIEEQARTGKRHGKNWKKEWGFGKSTFLYNVCDFINHNYLFHTIPESSKEPAYSRICGIFLPSPLKLDDVARQFFASEALVLASLPDHTPIDPKDVMRTVSISILREANKDDPAFNKAKTIQDVESFILQDPKKMSEALKKMDDFLDHKLPWGGKIKEDIKIGLLNLTYPIQSSLFQDGFRAVRVRINFERLAYLLKLARIFVVLVVDQIEYATGGQIKDLIKIVTDEERYGHIHLATVMRQDWKAWVKPSSYKDYETLTERLTEERLSPLTEDGAKDLIISLLDSFRKEEATVPDRYYPFSENAVEYIVENSRDPAVHNEIKPRLLLELTTRILSFAYRRCDELITKELLETPEYDALIQEVKGPRKEVEEEIEEMETLG